MYIFMHSFLIFSRITGNMTMEDDELTVLKFIIASEIRRRRTVLKISQLKMCELANCHLNTYNRIENGRAIPTLLTLIRISKALKCSVKDLFPD